MTPSVKNQVSRDAKKEFLCPGSLHFLSNDSKFTVLAVTSPSS